MPVATIIMWRFDNSYARLPEWLFSRLHPVPVTAPQLVIFNHALAQGLGLSAEALSPEAWAMQLAGNVLPPGAEPIAQAYAGHQFGHFTLLGDGRAIVVGEHLSPQQQRFDIQLKGSGRTPYSRSGDGRAALGPMLREYLISEAMQALGIPTTRSLAVVSTGETVWRDTALPGAILTRVASSHLRVGTFQYVAAYGDEQTLKVLLDYTLERHYPEWRGAANPALALLQAVMERQAALMAEWLRVGFIHGVMNTDNMAVSGETIDYGPCAFMDHYDPATVFSSIDRFGRYAFAQQPVMAQWNLARLAEALLPLIHPQQAQAVECAEAAIAGFSTLYAEQGSAMMRRKLGLIGDDAEDQSLINDLLTWMHRHHADYTQTFRALSTPHTSPSGLLVDAGFEHWRQRWRARQARNGQTEHSTLQQMQRYNPAIIPRNHHVERALEAATHADLQPLQRLLAALADPYTDHPEQAEYQHPPPPDQRVYQTFCGT